MRAFAFLLVAVLVAIGIGVGALSALAPVGGQTRSGDAHPERALCSAVPRLDRLVVTRKVAFPENHLRFSFPGTVVASKAAAVRSVALELCALPASPTGPISCPADLGVSYRLVFSGPDVEIAPVDIGAGGCEIVRGVGPTSRWLAGSSSFWTTLGRALGLARPDAALFSGVLPPSSAPSDLPTTTVA